MNCSNKLCIAVVGVVVSCGALIFLIISISSQLSSKFDETIDYDDAVYVDDDAAAAAAAEYADAPVNTEFRGSRPGHFKCQKNPKIYIDFIYNPHYYYELTILKFMLFEILDRNKNIMFHYDYNNLSNSTMITVGYEHSMFDTSERTIIQIKPKLLKDILYTENIFLQIYLFLQTNLRVCDPINVPEYDRSIDFNRYRQKFDLEVQAIDSFNPDVCRNDELFDIYNGRICIEPDLQYIRSIEFKFEQTREYWITLLTRVSTFMNVLLSKTLNLTNTKENCYNIKLRPEPNIRKVLLFAHKAVKTTTLDEFLDFDDVETRSRIMTDVITFKHRTLHALGMSHRYSWQSVMNAYTKPWQKPNIFFILPDDYKSLWTCYSRGKPYEPSVYVKNEMEVNDDLVNTFHFDFDSFMTQYEQMR